MLFRKRFPYNSETELAENLAHNSVLTLTHIHYDYIKAPPKTDVLFVGYDADAQKFVCTLPNPDRRDATFTIDFYDIERAWTPDKDRLLYEKTPGRM